MPRKPRAKVDASAFPITVPSLFDPKVFRAAERCLALSLSTNNSEANRNTINQLIVEIANVARDKYGHESVESLALRQLLKRTAPRDENYNPHAHPPEPDIIEYLQDQKRLTPTEYSAAMVIRSVWRAFGRYLTISGKGFDRTGGGKGASALGPVDVMGQETWEQWRDLYTPWYETAKARSTNRIKTGWVYNTELVFKIVVEGYRPEDLDKGFGMTSGAAYGALKAELGRFFDPHGITGRESPKDALNGAVAGTGGV